MAPGQTTIGILIFDLAEEMDFVGPWEVLGAARDKVPGLNLVLISRDGGVVTCEKGMRVLADHSFADAPHLDVILIPGGTGARLSVEDGETVDWLQRIAPDCAWITSVCTGALLLAGSGLIAGRRATTHHAFTDRLGDFGAVCVVTGQRFVRDGNLVTAAGVTSGIEMSLWLVREMFGDATEAYVRDYIAYDFPPRNSAPDLTGQHSDEKEDDG